MKKVLCSVVLGAGMLMPTIGTLGAQEHRDAVVKHEWNDGESDSWHKFLKERHKKDHEWGKANKHERADYWKWRDQHR
jgi:hypothetical protein